MIGTRIATGTGGTLGVPAVTTVGAILTITDTTAILGITAILAITGTMAILGTTAIPTDTRYPRPVGNEQNGPDEEHGAFLCPEISLSLFGDACMTQSWGGIGTSGRKIVRHFEHEEDAVGVFLAVTLPNHADCRASLAQGLGQQAENSHSAVSQARVKAAGFRLIADGFDEGGGSARHPNGCPTADNA